VKKKKRQRNKRETKKIYKNNKNLQKKKKKKNMEGKERKHPCLNNNVRAWVVSLGGKLRDNNQPHVK
jgi:hypothetical protein